MIICYGASVIISIVVSFIPLLPNLCPQPLILTLLFMSRDYFFNGRGFGKNLMGLQVVGNASGVPISLVQSWLRNLTLTAPLLVLELAAMLPGTLLPAFARDVLNILETVYALIVLPLESYRAYTREDSLRWGDLLAGTKIVQAQTNFDHLLPGRKN